MLFYCTTCRFIYIYNYIRIRIYMFFIYVYIYVHACICICVYIYTYIYICLYMLFIHTYQPCMYMCMNICMYVCMYVYTRLTAICASESGVPWFGVFGSFGWLGASWFSSVPGVRCFWAGLLFALPWTVIVPLRAHGTRSTRWRALRRAYT